MEFQEVIKNRRGTHVFSDKPIDDQVLAAIIKDAQRAPSWANAQATKVYIATGETLKKIKADHAASKGSGNSDIPTLHRQAWGERALANQGALMGSWKEFLGDMTQFGLSQGKLFDAAAIAYFTVPKGAPQWALIDLGAFYQTLMLAACNYGVSSMPAYEIVKFPEEIRKHMGVPDDECIAMGVALGYATDDKINQFVSPRVPVEDICTLKK